MKTMAFANYVNAVRNINSGVLFVLLDGGGVDNKMTIINPEGKVIVVPEGLFEKPFVLRGDELRVHLTEQQRQTLAKQSSPTRSRTSSGVKKGSSAKAAASRTPKFGIGAEWEGSKLTFYKHKIDPLMETQSFKINLDGHGSFVITKSEFSRIFNDVVIAPSYWQEGSYTYASLPEKAKKFLQKI